MRTVAALEWLLRLALWPLRKFVEASWALREDRFPPELADADEVQRDPRPDHLLETVEWDALAVHRGDLR